MLDVNERHQEKRERKLKTHSYSAGSCLYVVLTDRCMAYVYSCSAGPCTKLHDEALRKE